MTYYLKSQKLLPKGTVLSCVAVWDNSANNPINPNPNVEVKNGLQSEDEMMAGFIELGIEPDSDSWGLFTDAPVPGQPQKVLQSKN